MSFYMLKCSKSYTCNYYDLNKCLIIGTSLTRKVICSKRIRTVTFYATSAVQNKERGINPTTIIEKAIPGIKEGFYQDLIWRE